MGLKGSKGQEEWLCGQLRLGGGHAAATAQKGGKCLCHHGKACASPYGNCLEGIDSAAAGTAANTVLLEIRGKWDQPHNCRAKLTSYFSMLIFKWQVFTHK